MSILSRGPISIHTIFVVRDDSVAADRAIFSHEQIRSSSRIRAIRPESDQEIRTALGVPNTYRNPREGILVPILVDMPNHTREILRKELECVEKKGECYR